MKILDTVSCSYFHINTRGDFSFGVVGIPQASPGFAHNGPRWRERERRLRLRSLKNGCKCLKMHSAVTRACFPPPTAEHRSAQISARPVESFGSRLGRATALKTRMCVFLCACVFVEYRNLHPTGRVRTFWLIFSTSEDCFGFRVRHLCARRLENLLYLWKPSVSVCVCV